MRTHFEVTKRSSARPDLQVVWPPNENYPAEIKMNLPTGSIWFTVKEADDLAFALSNHVRLAQPEMRPRS